MTAEKEKIAGYDVPAVETWIREHIKSLVLPLRWTRLEGGHSNLTYMIEDEAGAKAVIRRPPLGELLPKAHDMGREWSIISALGQTTVPVPQAFGFCEDRSVTGAHFYIMGHVDGHPLYNAADTRKWVPEEHRETLAFSYVDVLADLHSIDPEAVGLSDLGKPTNYVGRQLRTWHQSWMSSIEGAKYDDPRAHTLQKYFLDNLPNQGPPRIVHGDYGVHNTLTGRAFTIAAVVDWEISTLGDPLADLAYALIPFPDPSDNFPPKPGAALNVPGFPSRTLLLERYAARTGSDLTRLDYYVGFNRWKSAAIVHGVYSRYLEGKKSTEGVDLDELRARITALLSQGEEAVARYREAARR